MRNLKRALSLVMASVMLIGMMAVGAGAADFPDSDKIQNIDAVDTMVSLGIINGKDDGNFDPEGIVTRAEMAKMICVALNGGRDPNLAGGGSFPDTVGNWAGGYIDYCANRGIVAGDQNGNFNPGNTVTGTEAAKMILIAMGYNAATENFEGDAKWDININVVASTVGLYDNVSINAADGLSRDNAAQMIYDGMQAPMVRYEMVGISGGEGISQAVEYEDGRTILTRFFDMKTAYAYLTGISYDSRRDEYTYTVTGAAAMGSGSLTQDDGVTLATSYKSSKDFSDLYGQQVKILFKDDSARTVYGIAANDSSVLVSAIGGNLPSSISGSATTVRIDGTTYDLTGTASTIPVYNYNVTTGSQTLSGLTRTDIAAYAIALIDNDGDDEGDVLVVYPVTVAQVTFVGRDSITAGNVSYDFDDCDIYEDVARDDYVVITAAANTARGRASIEEAQVVSGTVGATRSGEVRVDGTWYTDAATKSGDSYTIGDDFDLVVVNGYVYNAKAVSSSTNVGNSVYVLAVDDPATGLNVGTQRVRLLFADGTKQTVTVDRVDSKIPGTLNAIASDNKVTANQVYTYATDRDGNYELTRIDASDFDRTLAVASGNGITVNDGRATRTGASDTFRFADDAVVFVKPAGSSDVNDIDVVTGRVVNSWKSSYTTTTDAPVTTTNAQVDQNILYADRSSGFYYTQLGVLVLTGQSSVPGAGGSQSYGWIATDPSVVKDGDYYYVELTLWNGEDEVTVLADEKSNNSFTLSDYAKGTPISYDDLGDGKIENVTSLAAKADAVTGYNNGTDIVFETAGDAEIDNDTVILYVDTADNEGLQGGSIVTAQEDVLGNFVKNVYADVDDGKVTYIFVDTTNNLAQNKKLTTATDAVITAINADDHTATVANTTTASALLAVVVDWTGYAAADVVTSTSNSANVDGGTALADGNVLRVTSTDGTYYYFVITVAPPVES